MNKQNISQLVKARKNCIHNAEMLLWGDDTCFPSIEDIKKAEHLLSVAQKIDLILSEATL